MQTSNQAPAQSLPPQAQLIQMATAHWVSRHLHVAAQMKLADLLAGGPRSADELAHSTNTNAPSLYRFLRTLASLGLFTESAEHRFSLAPLGEPLRADTTNSVRTSVLTLTGDVFTKSLDELFYSVQTGKTGFEKAFGMPLFKWLSSHPSEASMFSETMVGFHGAEPAAVAAAYDFSKSETIVDVGGATGNLLATILNCYSEPLGVLFDLPHVVRDAPVLIKARGLTERIRIEAGNFFERVPAVASTYLLSHVIHDWGEDECLMILGNCRQAMKSNSRLLIIEMVLPTGDTPHPGKILDINMLAITGGQERTEPEYRALLDKAGFRLARVVPTKSEVNVLEAFPR